MIDMVCAHRKADTESAQDERFSSRPNVTFGFGGGLRRNRAISLLCGEPIRFKPLRDSWQPGDGRARKQSLFLFDFLNDARGRLDQRSFCQDT